MFSRRDLLMSGMFASSMRAADDGGQQRVPASTADGPTANDIHEIRDAILGVRRLTPSGDVTQIQERQRLHFKLNQKFPNYIDIGFTVWERLSIWHLEN